MVRASAALLALFAAACGTTSSPAPAPAPAQTAAAAPAVAPTPAGCPADPAAATADQNLRAMVGQGEALPDHVGPDVARAMFADLDREPARYLARFECAFVSPTPSPGFDSLLLAIPLWRLHAHDPARVKQLAARLVYRYDELRRTPPDPAQDPHFEQRVAERVATMRFIRDGLDVPAAATWKPVTAFLSCTTATPDGRAAIRVTRECSCGETLSCAATPGARGTLALAVRYDPDSPAMCTDCYPTSTACSVPPATAPAALPARCVP